MRVEAILFDLFNTLVLLENDDTFYLPSLKKLCESLTGNGVNIPFEDFKSVYFQIRDRLYVETSQTLEEPHFNIRISRTLCRFGYDFRVSHPTIVNATKAFCDEFLRYVRLDDDTDYLLRKLHKKYKLGIVSNFAIPECIDMLFEKLPLKEFFDVIMISGAINRRKPHPEIFERALKTLGVEPSRAVFVGDTPSMDIKGAKNVGIKAVLIKREPSPSTDSTSFVYKPIEDANVAPDRIIGSLRELPDLLEDC